MISVVIPLYNKEKQIENTLQTVFNQTFQDFEIIIVNDGSTDRSLEIVQQFTEDRITIINQENQGVSAARNRGIQEAKYEYLALLDADDEWSPDYLQTQVDLIYKYTQCDVFVCAYQFKSSNGEIKDPILNKLLIEENCGILTNYFEVAFCSHPPITSISIVVSKKAMCRIGGFPCGVIAGEDLLTWAKLALYYKIAYCKIPKVFFCHSESENYQEAPSRAPDSNDIVGNELQQLYRKNSQVKGLRQYLALWYKMRASMFLLFGDNRTSCQESCKALKYNPWNIKVWAYLLLLPFPLSLRYKIFQKLGHA